ncbi:hypothetical protein RhiJN_23920 [Ceratobasidium sp. AG-Ba]|nr:hypothetical protein RhiJN_23920 [Ceratobasidium sp. AG-Ba]
MVTLNAYYKIGQGDAALGFFSELLVYLSATTAMGPLAGLQSQVVKLQKEIIAHMKTVELQLADIRKDISGFKAKLQKDLFGFKSKIKGELKGAQDKLNNVQGQLEGIQGKLKSAQAKLKDIWWDLHGVHNELEDGQSQITQIKLASQITQLSPKR